MSSGRPAAGTAARYLARRAGFYLLAAFFAVSFNFLIPRLMPGDPAAVMFGRFQGRMDPSAIEALKATFGMTDAPLWRQYLGYLGHMLRGDLGVSVAYFPEPVSAVLGRGLGWTVALAGCSLLIAFVVGSSLGVVAAWRRGGLLDRWLPPTLALISAFPYFWLAMALLWLLGFQLDWFPLRHAYDQRLEPGLSLPFIGSAIRHAALPAATLVLVGLAGWLMSMRASMVSILGEDFIQFGYARGLSQRRLLLAYAVRNALLPNLTAFGMAIGFVLSGTLLTEIVFSYPGQGYLLIQAVRSQDFPLLQGLFLTITLAVLLASFLVDVMVLALDPRTR